MEALASSDRVEDRAGRSVAPDMQWIYFGMMAGFLTCFIYPALLVFGQGMPLALAATLVAMFGPLLAVASIGLSRLLSLERSSFFAQAAAVMNAIAGMLFSVMLLVQLAVPAYTKVDRSPREIVALWLALDIGWDVYVGLGTALFAIAMFGHPHFGRWFAFSGLVLATLLLVLNLWKFPVPPANAGLFDIGPFVGAWYLVATIQTLRSLRWARERL